MATAEQWQSAIDKVMSSLERNSDALGDTITRLIAETTAEIAAAPLEWVKESKTYHTTNGQFKISYHGPRNGYSAHRRNADAPADAIFAWQIWSYLGQFRTVAEAKAAATASWESS